MGSKEQKPIRALQPGEAIPFELLLLADETKEAIGRYLHGASLYVWEEAEKIVGVYVLAITGPRQCEIMNIAVAREWQGRGIGFHLLTHAITTARDMGFRWLDVGTSNAAWGPLYLYQKAGFEIDRIRKHFYRDHYPVPIFENRLLLNHMIVLRKALQDTDEG
ncbi:GNAT family N-acetyltransferase [Taibaiella koreensis]|uniref:GNAT family N-acetyltransferase n=1 Tax=Taibaiella koreensis TaxID=1268548 RepID=UPI0013C2F510|nr:GNAT family N-acetyltransferase [Taibaiella koreensis]